MEKFITIVRFPIGIIAVIVASIILIIDVIIRFFGVFFSFFIETAILIVAVPFLAIFQARREFPKQLISLYPYTIKLCFKGNKGKYEKCKEEFKFKQQYKEWFKLVESLPYICEILKIWPEYYLIITRIWKWIFED